MSWATKIPGLIPFGSDGDVCFAGPSTERYSVQDAKGFALGFVRGAANGWHAYRYRERSGEGVYPFVSRAAAEAWVRTVEVRRVRQ